jgi:hypothetical protein
MSEMMLKFVSWLFSFFGLSVVSLDEMRKLREIRSIVSSYFFKSRLNINNDSEEVNMLLTDICVGLNQIIGRERMVRKVSVEIKFAAQYFIHVITSATKEIYELYRELSRRRRMHLELSYLLVGFAGTRRDSIGYSRLFCNNIAARRDCIYVCR